MKPADAFVGPEKRGMGDFDPNPANSLKALAEFRRGQGVAKAKSPQCTTRRRRAMATAADTLPSRVAPANATPAAAVLQEQTKITPTDAIPSKSGPPNGTPAAAVLQQQAKTAPTVTPTPQQAAATATVMPNKASRPVVTKPTATVVPQKATPAVTRISSKADITVTVLADQTERTVTAKPTATVVPQQSTPAVTRNPIQADIAVTVGANRTTRTVTANTAKATAGPATSMTTGVAKARAKKPLTPQARRSLRIRKQKADNAKPETQPTNVARPKPKKNNNGRNRRKKPRQTKGTPRMKPGGKLVTNMWGDEVRVHAMMTLDLTPNPGKKRGSRARKTLAAKAAMSKCQTTTVCAAPAAHGSMHSPTPTDKKVEATETATEAINKTTVHATPSATTAPATTRLTTTAAGASSVTPATHRGQTETCETKTEEGDAGEMPKGDKKQNPTLPYAPRPSHIQELLDTAWKQSKFSSLCHALVLDGLLQTNNHKRFAGLLKQGIPRKESKFEIQRYMNSSTVLDQGHMEQQRVHQGIHRVECVRKSTTDRKLSGAADHNACCRTEMGKARCTLCLSVVCLHHSVCDHRPPKRCKINCMCDTCQIYSYVGFNQVFRVPEPVVVKVKKADTDNDAEGKTK